jgi:hypothetical protein
MNLRRKQSILKVALRIACVWSVTASAARVVFFPADPTNPDVENRLRLACRFYGIDLQTGAGAQNSETPTVAVVEAEALRSLARSDLPSGTRGFLIAGISSKTPADALHEWSGVAIESAETTLENLSGSYVDVSKNNPALTGELTGQKLPVDIAKGASIKADLEQVILSYADGAPLFAEVQSAVEPTYLLADLKVLDPPDSSIWFYDRGFFAEIAPYMMFLRKSFGEYAWHTDDDYANLTIDDPWLCESYGNLNFAELLREMDRAGFHTTIAYIPWNYDRSSASQTVKIFRDRPDRFSLCVHGNNHDHREFYSYEEKPNSEWPARPLTDQEADIRQGLARIEVFEKENDLSVDRVMVFPHGIAPDETLGLLRKYNYKATSNAGYVPLDTPLPTDPLFWLRRVSGRFGGGLASLDRAEPANLIEADIAIDLFLDNPVAFVEHLRFFSDSRAAFNPFARKVNSIQPAVKWVGLGELAEHLYLMRREDDNSWSVRSFSPDIILKNPDARARNIHFSKPDDGSVPVREVRIGGEPVDFFQTLENKIQVDFTLAPQQTKRIEIVYENDFDATLEDLSKPDFRVNLLRQLSNVRDQYLIAGPLGAFIDRFYYDSNFYQFGMKGLLAAAAAVLLIPLALVLFFVVRKKRRQAHG